MRSSLHDLKVNQLQVSIEYYTPNYKKKKITLMTDFVKDSSKNYKLERVELEKNIPIIVSIGMTFIQYNSLIQIDPILEKTLYD